MGVLLLSCFMPSVRIRARETSCCSPSRLTEPAPPIALMQATSGRPAPLLCPRGMNIFTLRLRRMWENRSRAAQKSSLRRTKRAGNSAFATAPPRHACRLIAPNPLN